MSDEDEGLTQEAGEVSKSKPYKLVPVVVHKNPVFDEQTGKQYILGEVCMMESNKADFMVGDGSVRKPTKAEWQGYKDDIAADLKAKEASSVSGSSIPSLPGDNAKDITPTKGNK